MAKAKKKKFQPNTKTISGDQLFKAITKLGFNMQSFGRAINVNGRTVQSWCDGKHSKGKPTEVPRVVAVLVNLMIDTEATEEHLRP